MNEKTPNGIDRQIIWEKWADPYGADIESTEWPGALDGPMEEEENSFDKEEEFGPEEESIDLTNRPMKIILTPMGMVPLTEYTTPSRIFKFWVAHTNFDVTSITKDKIDKTLGVEFLDVFSRYRFRVAVGKAFKDSDVMDRISQNLDAKPLEEKIDAEKIT